ncbi:MAG: 5-dehydro-2-deoxygluconokinase [Pyrinomonadaceae bacterium]
MTDKRYDLLAIGRSSIDLYAREIGAAFVDIQSFAAYVGGCPTNISVGAQRLHLRTALLTPTGDDLVGDFVHNFLAREGVAADFSPRKRGRRTSAFLLAIQPPDKFPIVPYRDNCADLELTIADVQSAPISETRALLVTGSGLSREPSSTATVFAAEQARAHGAQVVLDLDLRPELWPDPTAYGAAVNALLPFSNIVIGTMDEVVAVIAHDADDAGVEALLVAGLDALVIKRGAASTIVRTRAGEMIEAATFPVEVLNVLGAGDAFAAGFLYGHLRGWDWHKAARMGNACGAIVVTRHGCANFMPDEREALAFIEERGGF